MPDENTHLILQQAGARWLKDHGFPLVQIESHTVRKEHPDVIGFSLAYSAIIECKASDLISSGIRKRSQDSSLELSATSDSISLQKE